MPIDLGYVLLARGVLSPTADASVGNVAAPGSGATITLWTSENNVTTGTEGLRVKRLMVNIYTSHASAASGLSFEESNDGGTNWDVVVAYSIGATTYTKNTVAMYAPMMRVRLTNSANVLTAWRMAVLTDTNERAAG